jgi:hypothetical protein
LRLWSPLKSETPASRAARPHHAAAASAQAPLYFETRDYDSGQQRLTA